MPVQNLRGGRGEPSTRSATDSLSVPKTTHAAAGLLSVVFKMDPPQPIAIKNKLLEEPR